MGGLRPRRTWSKTGAPTRGAAAARSRSAPTGALHAIGDARFSPLGRVHVAGTEAAYAWSGYIEGAIRGGERVAADVAGALA